MPFGWDKHLRSCFIALITGFVLWGCDGAPETWHKETILSGLPVHGLQGLTFGPDEALYVGSVMSQNIVRVDVTTGALEDVIPAPVGEADDLAFGPDGSLAWTAINAGELRLRTPEGVITTIATDGTLYAATLFGPDRLWAYDLSANTSRIVAQGLGGLNAFEFGEDGALYTPLPSRQAIGKIDANTGTLTVIAEAVGNVVAVKFHPDGLMYGVSWDDGVVQRIDPVSGWTETVALVEPPLDNLAIDEDGILYVTRSADNGIVAVDPISGNQRLVVRSDLAAPGGMTWIERNDQPHLLITDIFGYRYADPQTGDVTLLPFDLENGASADVDVREGLMALSYVRRNRVLLKDAGTGDVLQTWLDVPSPYGVLIERNGSVLAAVHETGAIIRLDLNTPDTHATVIRGLNEPVGMVWVEKDMSLYVAEAGAGRISRVNLNTAERFTVAAQLSQPETLAVLPDGRLVVTEVGVGRITVIDLDTGDKNIIADALALGGAISRSPHPVGMPTGLAVDTDGSVYVVTDRNNGLIKLTRE